MSRYYTLPVRRAQPFRTPRYFSIAQVIKGDQRSKDAKTARRSRSKTRRNSDAEDLAFLGVRRFRFGRVEEHNEIGLVTGLAWTEVGGDLLQIEASLVPGKGAMILTASSAK